MSEQSNVHQVFSRGIYHGLPTFPSSMTGLTAIVTGANGISGNAMVQVLAESPQRWKKIYCLSRRPPWLPPTDHQSTKDRVQIEHVSVDFLQDPAQIAAALQNKGIASADYVFFFSYVQPQAKASDGLWSGAEELLRVNRLLLKNFLDALTHASIIPKRFMLQTGAKNYGLHLGPTKLPQTESDPQPDVEPNFYYAQEAVLFEWCKSSKPEVQWNVVMPSRILGAVPDAAMNAAYSLAIYASVCKKLKQPLRFPGDFSAWTMPQSTSSAMMNAYLEEWAVLTPHAGNHRFNVEDSSSFTWEEAWPLIAKWYGIEPQGPISEESATYTEKASRYNIRGYGPKGVKRSSFTMVEWAKTDEVVHAWRELAREYDLRDKDLDNSEGYVDKVFGFADNSLIRDAPIYFSMNKSRKMGWHGFVDSYESLLQVFHDLAAIKMVPPPDQEPEPN